MTPRLPFSIRLRIFLLIASAFLILTGFYAIEAHQAESFAAVSILLGSACGVIAVVWSVVSAMIRALSRSDRDRAARSPNRDVSGTIELPNRAQDTTQPRFPSSIRIPLSLTLASILLVLTGFVAGETYEVVALPAVLTLLGFACGLIAVVWFVVLMIVGAWQTDHDRRHNLHMEPEATRPSGKEQDVSVWQEFKQAIGFVVSVVSLVVALARGLPAMWEATTEAWEFIPRRFTQIGPICKYVAVDLLRSQSGLEDILQMTFDGATVSASGRQTQSSTSMSRPVVLALKNVKNGSHELTVRARLHNREYRLRSSVKLLDFADFYFFDVEAREAEGDRAQDTKGEELRASVGLIQPSIVLKELSRADLALPPCSSLPNGPSMPPLSRDRGLPRRH